MPAATARKLAALQASVIDDTFNVEIVNGVTLMSPRPSPGHASAAHALAFALGPAFDDHYRSRRSGRPPRGPGGWRILPEPELHLRGNTLIPDLAGWRSQRLPSLPKTAFIAVHPDWVCEILSPKTKTSDREDKMPAYAKAEVPFVWLVSVQKCSVEVYRLAGRAYEPVATYSGNKRVRIEPFAELPLDLATLWP